MKWNNGVQVVEEGGAGMANVSKTLALDRLGKRLPFGETLSLVWPHHATHKTCFCMQIITATITGMVLSGKGSGLESSCGISRWAGMQ